MSGKWSSIQFNQYSSTIIPALFLHFVLIRILGCKWNKLILNHLRPKEEFNGQRLGYLTWIRDWLAIPCQGRDTCRRQEQLESETWPLPGLCPGLSSAFQSMMALFALYLQSDILCVIDVMSLGSSHHQGRTGTLSLSPGIEFGGVHWLKFGSDTHPWANQQWPRECKLHVLFKKTSQISSLLFPIIGLWYILANL